ncbi:MAG TPA: H-type lectin domain-containing protein [Polyangiaceae bacterium]|nr:H-type lectin domain-containing protein [Polyangiaceae bacterium]
MSILSPLSMLSAVVSLGSLLDGWTLLDGSGTRTFRHAVMFEHAFSAPPLVHVGVAGLDASKDDNLRLRVRAEDITRTGFSVVVETWLNTQLWAVDVSWLAIGH